MVVHHNRVAFCDIFSVVFLNQEACSMFDDLPPFMTIEQAAQVLQLGRSKAYQLSVECEHTGGASGLPFVWFGHQKRIPRAALERFVARSLAPPPAA
jgi:hypothetical protein